MPDESTATENNADDVVVDSPTTDGPVTDIDPDSPPTDPDEATQSISTIADDASPAEALTTDAEEPGAGDDKELSAEEIARFDKHPRFQEIIGQRDEARNELSNLRSEVDFLKDQIETTKAPEKSDALPYKDITQMTKEDLADWQEEDPVGYASNLYQQVVHEAKQTILLDQERREQESSIDKTYREFGEKHSGFNSMWKGGEIQKYMDSNPGHNAISAYHEIKAESTGADTQAAIDKAVAKAVAAKEAEMLKNFKAKKNATVIGRGPAQGAALAVDPELSNTRAKGGLVSTIAARLVASRGG